MGVLWCKSGGWVMDTGFFKWVWRFNAVMLAGLAVLAGLGGGIVILEKLLRPGPSQATLEVAAPDPAQDIPPRRYHYGPVTALGAGAYYAPLRLTQGDPDKVFYKSSDRNTVNYVRFGDGPAQWLFEGHDQLIIRNARVMWPPDPQAADPQAPAPRVTARLLEVIEHDSNGDGQLSLADQKSLYVATPGLDAAQPALEGYGAFTLVEQPAEGVVTVAARRNGQVTLFTLSVPKGTLRGTLHVPPPNP